jgi:hypothetical protein
MRTHDCRVAKMQGPSSMTIVTGGDPEFRVVDPVIARRCLRVAHVSKAPLLPFAVATWTLRRLIWQQHEGHNRRYTRDIRKITTR